jgi:hypothetical protein
VSLLSGRKIHFPAQTAGVSLKFHCCSRLSFVYCNENVWLEAGNIRNLCQAMVEMFLKANLVEEDEGLSG